MFAALMFYCGMYANLHQMISSNDSDGDFQTQFTHFLPRPNFLTAPDVSSVVARSDAPTVSKPATAVVIQPTNKPSLDAFQANVINPVLMKIDLYSQSASNLLLGTAIQESLLGKLSNNVFQIELQTVEDINSHYLIYHPRLNAVIHELYNSQHSINWNLNNNVKYEVAMARLIYLRSNQQLPSASNVGALAWFWKRNYNTIQGKGTAYEFASHFDEYALDGHAYQWTMPTESFTPHRIYNLANHRHMLVFNA